MNLITTEILRRVKIGSIWHSGVVAHVYFVNLALFSRQLASNVSHLIRHSLMQRSLVCYSGIRHRFFRGYSHALARPSCCYHFRRYYLGTQFCSGDSLIFGSTSNSPYTVTHAQLHWVIITLVRSIKISKMIRIFKLAQVIIVVKGDKCLRVIKFWR